MPVPAVFLSKEPASQRLLVIDGQQRLTSLRYFYGGLFRTGEHSKEFRLKGVSSDLENLTYETLPDEDRRRLDDSLLHAIIVNQVDPADDQTGLYSIFERINTGGTPLQPQEIRACIYEGPFIALLRELAQDDAWLQLYGAPSPRAKDQELILRFLALYFNSENYERPMKHFLNRFVASNRNLELHPAAQIREVFGPAVALACERLGRSAFRPVRNLNAAILDSVLFGLAKRIELGPITHPERLASALDALKARTDYNDAYRTGTTDETKLATRLQLAEEAFAEVS